MTVIDHYLPSRTNWVSQPAHNDNMVNEDDTSPSRLDRAEVAYREDGKDKPLPPFTSVLIWILLAVIGWGAIALAIRLL
ncbi:MAG TPA: hypothetical protein VLL04_14140 [Rhizomicrobium sp.]|nr:hypothetical protein [Rhizomicrobium sp.]